MRDFAGRLWTTLGVMFPLLSSKLAEVLSQHGPLENLKQIDSLGSVIGGKPSPACNPPAAVFRHPFKRGDPAKPPASPKGVDTFAYSMTRRIAALAPGGR